MIGKFTKVSLGMLVLVGSMGMANAAGTVSNATSQQVTLNVLKSQRVAHTITPVGVLYAGQSYSDGIVVANGTVSAVDGLSQTSAVRFDASTQGAAGASKDIFVVNGDTAPANHLTLRVQADDTTVDAVDGWVYQNSAKPKMDYRLVTAVGPQTLSADTYTITMQAGTWAN